MLEWPILLRELITLFVVIDPIGSLPVFLFATANVPQHLHKSFALRAVLVAGLVLLGFLVGGQYLLENLGLRLGSFQVAGGIILFLFALSMIFGDPKPTQEIEAAERDHLAGAVFPLAMPSIASPGAMLAIVILTDNHTNQISDQLVTAGLLACAFVARGADRSPDGDHGCQRDQPRHGDHSGDRRGGCHAWRAGCAGYPQHRPRRRRPA